jgi:ribose 5-phosphate isomerase A
MSQDDDKRAAAVAAAAEVRDGMLVGLGTGSTAAFLIDELGRRHAAGLRFRAVATSLASEARAKALGIEVLPFADVTAIDLAIDGADEIDPALRAIKGAGGAMLREKCVAASAGRMIVIADASKRADRLGAAPVPCEVLPFALGFVLGRLAECGGAPVVRSGSEGPYLTDQGNHVADTRFAAIDRPEELARTLSQIPGLLGHGLFVDEVDALYCAENGRVTVTERPHQP